MPNLTPEVKDRLMKLDRICEMLGKEDGSTEVYLKNFRELIGDLLEKPESFTPKEFADKYSFVRGVVTKFHFGRQAKSGKRGNKL